MKVTYLEPLGEISQKSNHCGYFYRLPKFTAMGGISGGLQTLDWDLERDFGTSRGSQ
jgi:hypothetical protein